ncbi:type IV pili twitching motility protein PilT [Candidatus Gottesmanbacteria bacterium RBG_16_52_11]|uniref:Type IV pili twitching motility protein PilT n=1 Tax=Candidatus Gottesmanbacteria bacterium RBG_16_52_11 TaxID=1798374 RepID=A0A1F5YNS6_9BACT|nr:MAG: type IV pili twitching motility protein PilT [Candidatus Gottesmanbacteria bacterium RBG_16_52_11]
MDIQEYFAEAGRLEASDLHLLVGFPPILRVNGVLGSIEGIPVLTATDVEQLAFSVLSAEQKDLLLTNKEIDISVPSQYGRFRVNIYNQKGTYGGAFRLIPDKIRTIDELGLPAICHDFVKLHQGFILVTGPTGHGKSTTLAAMINEINLSRSHHIVTIEDPIEYVYPIAKSIISQREMHQDTHSWAVALRSVLRQDPNVVLVGEMRDYETIEAAITIAETGHLVFATLHTNSASQTIDRIVDVFPENQQAQIRLQLSNVLEGVLSQRLLPAMNGGRVAVTEVMTATPAIRTVVREGKTHQIDNIIQTSAELGMMTLEANLAQLVIERKISVEVATNYAVRPDDLARRLKLR